MTETKKMRAILRERGIEYRDVNSMVTDIEHDGIKTRVYDYDDGPDYQLCVEQKWLTAEEAVRVALGIKPQEVLERRIDKLCAEVETEKQRNDKLFEAAEKWMAKAAHFEAENAKLRELARGLGQCAQGVSCEDCLLHDLSEPDHCREERLSRELGIEVEE